MLKNAKFMLILAFALASSLAIADKVAEKEIKEITDANFYSAGKTTAESIDTWMKKEIQPELFDIWLGKKTRFYLNGSWKLMKLSNTRENPKSVFGLKKGFEKKDFDDSKWFNQPVPYLWNSYFPNKRKVIVFGGIGWYRKTFTLPKTFSGKRTILAFGAVANECEVYVNGKKVGGHVNLCSDHPNGLTHQREEGFELDITDALVPNGQNTLSMKVYDDGLHYRSPKLKKMVGIGGIWQEVYLESRPAIYLKRALISPVFASSEIKVKAFVVNTLKNSVQINPSVQLSPWQSKRYTLAKGPASSVKLRSFLLSSGKNELDFTVTMENPQCWSPEHPYLYHFKLLNEKGDILGQERFGFRQFTAGQNSFKLNGKDIFLMGQQALWSSWQSAPGPSILLGELGILNRRHVIENWYDAYLGMNLNLIRTHTSHYPHSFYEIGDEQGALIYGEEHLLNSFKGDDTQMKKYYENGDLTPFLKEKIRDKAIFCYNYPSIVMRSMGNECYDQLFVNKPQGLTSWAPLLDLLYKEYKRIDPTRPVTASSGRPPTNESCRIAGAHLPTWCRSNSMPCLFGRQRKC